MTDDPRLDQLTNYPSPPKATRLVFAWFYQGCARHALRPQVGIFGTFRTNNMFGGDRYPQATVNFDSRNRYHANSEDDSSTSDISPHRGQRRVSESRPSSARQRSLIAPSVKQPKGNPDWGEYKIDDPYQDHTDNANKQLDTILESLFNIKVHAPASRMICFSRGGSATGCCFCCCTHAARAA